MSKRLEEFVKTTRDKFEDIEPSAELWGRIEKDLPVQFGQKKNQAKTFSLGFVLRIAASVIVVMGVCFVFYLRKQNTINYANINPVYAEQQIQYTKLIANKQVELQSIAKT